LGLTIKDQVTGVSSDHLRDVLTVTHQDFIIGTLPKGSRNQSHGKSR